jgi:chromosome segregation ATPase
MREFDLTIQEKTDRLNQLTLTNEELERRVAERDRANDRLREQLRDMDERLDATIKIKHDQETAISQQRQDVDALLATSKSQSELVFELKEKLGSLKTKCDEHDCMLEAWHLEREDLMQQKTDIQAELYSYMTRLSESQIHKENLEIDLRGQIKSQEEKLRSATVLLDEKEAEISALQERINELNEDLQRRIESEINHLKYFNESSKEEENALKTAYEEEIGQLRDENEKLKVCCNI